MRGLWGGGVGVRGGEGEGEGGAPLWRFGRWEMGGGW